MPTRVTPPPLHSSVTGLCITVSPDPSSLRRGGNARLLSVKTVQESAVMKNSRPHAVLSGHIMMLGRMWHTVNTVFLTNLIIHM